MDKETQTMVSEICKMAVDLTKINSTTLKLVKALENAVVLLDARMTRLEVLQPKLSAEIAYQKLQRNKAAEDIGYATEENGGWADREEGIRYAD